MDEVSEGLQQIGNYRLLHLIGRGHSADVYLGEHIYLGSQAALKVLQGQFTQDATDRFLSQSQMLAQFEHPNLVRVLEFGVIDKTPFLVMEYAPYGTLRQLYTRGSCLSLATLLPYVKQIATVLQYIHDNHYIHGDVKPENILLGHTKEIVLGDFGLVNEHKVFSTVQEVKGTIAYIAPEQLLGKPCPASDQYALGITLYEWLSGDVPFHGGFSEIAAQHALIPPPSLQKQHRDISNTVEQVIFKALAKKPEDRFINISAFFEAFEQACHEWAVSDKKRTSKSSPRRTVLICLGLIGLVGIGGSLAWEMSTRSRQLSFSPQPSPSLIQQGATLQTYSSSSVAWLPNSTRVMLFTKNMIEVRDIMTGKRLQSSNIHSPVQSSLQSENVYYPFPPNVFSPTGKYLAISVSENDHAAIQVVDTSNGNIIRTHSIFESSYVTSLAWSKDEKYLAIGLDGNSIPASFALAQIWSLQSEKNQQMYQGNVGPSVEAIAWSPDNRYVVSGSGGDVDFSVQVWNPITGKHISTYSKHIGDIYAVAWSPDSRRVASGGRDQTVQIWDTFSAKSLHTYGGHASAIGAIAWSPDGHFVASGSADGVIQIWDAGTGKTVFTYRTQTSSTSWQAIHSIVWASNGTFIASIDRPLPINLDSASTSASDTLHIWKAI